MTGIFLSCVSREFHGPTSPDATAWPGSYRGQLASFLDRCGQHVVYQEQFAQGGGDLLAKLDEYIRRDCKAVIHLVGHAAGWCPEDDLPAGAASATCSDAVNALLEKYGDALLSHRPELRRQLLARSFRGISYTQWEAYLAIHHNKPLLVFHVDATAPRHPEFLPNAGPRADRLSQSDHFLLLQQTGMDRDERIRDQNHFKEAAITALFRDQVLTRAEITPRPRCQDFDTIGTLFKGRDPDMARLRDSLRKASTHATAIVASQVIYGEGGIGKTRLAIEFGLLHEDEYSALLFVGANSPEAFESNLAQLAGPLVLNLPGLPDNAAPEVKIAAVLGWLDAHPRWFLIIDNVDSEAAAVAVEARLAQLRAGYVVITSRIGHWPASVETLELDVLSEDASVEFLLEATARKGASGRSITPTDAADARLLAKDVDGLALALEQSAAYIRTNGATLAQYRTRWAAFDEKVRDWYDSRVMKYPRSVATTWQSTFDQLTPASVDLLRVCALLAPAPIPVELLELAASELGADLETGLTPLVKFCLAHRSEDGASLRVHRLIQEIVAHRKDDVQRRSTLGRTLGALIALYRWPGTVAEELVDHTRTPQRVAAFPHAESALRHADGSSAEAHGARAARLRAELAHRLQITGNLPAAAKAIDAAIDWGEQQTPRDERGLAIWYASRASIRQVRGDLAGAEQDIARSIDWGEKQTPRDERGLAIWSASRARILLDSDKLDEALVEMERAVEIERRVFGDNGPGRAVTLGWYAMLLARMKRTVEAHAAMEKARELDRLLVPPDSDWVWTVERYQAVVQHACGSAAEAKRHFEAALHSAARCLEPHDHCLGILHRQFGEFLADTWEAGGGRDPQLRKAALAHAEESKRIFAQQFEPAHHQFSKTLQLLKRLG